MKTFIASGQSLNSKLCASLHSCVCVSIYTKNGFHLCFVTYVKQISDKHDIKVKFNNLIDI